MVTNKQTTADYKRTTVYLPNKLHQKIAALSRDKRRSFSAQVVVVLEEYFPSEEVDDG
jgi:hypothetical protein